MQMGIIRSPVGTGSPGPHVTTRRNGTAGRGTRPQRRGCVGSTNPDLPNAKPSPLWGEGVERSETDEGDVPTSRRLNIRIGGRYPPHPSSGFRETPDATFPPEGGRLCRSPGKLPFPSLVPYCLLPIACCLIDKSQFAARNRYKSSKEPYRFFGGTALFLS